MANNGAQPTNRFRARFIVEVDLDQVPGVMNTVESARGVISNVLNFSIAHYNPSVTAVSDEEIAPNS